ncbi:MAG: hypothetical protein ABW185_23120 [Sedimenticola sp.]
MSEKANYYRALKRERAASRSRMRYRNNKHEINEKRRRVSTDESPKPPKSGGAERTQKWRQSKKLKRQWRREYQKMYRARAKCNENTHGEEDNTRRFKNRMSRYRALRRLNDSLPKTPSKRIDVIESYLARDSPTANTVKSDLINSVKENNKLTENVLSNMKTFIDSTKCKRSNDCRATMNILTASVSGENLVNSKMCLAKKLGVTPRRLSGGKRIRTEILKGEKSCFQYTQRKTRSDCLSDENKRIIYDFWKSHGISRPSCNKNEVKRVRLDKNVYSSHVIYVLEKTQTECFLEFKAKFTDIKLSQRSFEKCKPYFVQPAREKHRNTCCCRYHTEIHYVFKSCMKFRKAQHQTWSADDQLEYPVFDHLSDAVESTLCPKPKSETYSKKKCLDRECGNCGVHKLLTHPTEMSESENSETVTWSRYEYADLKVKGRCIRKLMLVEKKTKPGQLFSYFKHIMGTFSSHNFRASWQNDQMKALIESLPENHCIAIHDFSENYSCSERDELQSTFFSKTECTIHVTILHRHAILEFDGEESTPDNRKIITEQIFVISPDLQHDNCFTQEVQKRVAGHLNDIGYNVECMYEFTDGCSQQYKSRHCMGDVSNIDLGYKSLVRNYYETSHAKGPQDAAGGCIKHMADMAVIRGSASIQNAKDFYTFGKNNLSSTKSVCKRRIFKYIEQVNRENKVGYKSISNNRKIHQITRDGPFGKLQVRELSCYSCNRCMDGQIKRCKNSHICGNIKNITLEPEGKQKIEGSECLEERVSSFRDIIQKGNVVAAFTDDPQAEYYLLQANREPHRLETDTSDNWGNVFNAGTEVVSGYYYKQQGLGHSYTLIPRLTAIVPFLSVRYICSDVGLFKRSINVSENVHLDILESIEQFMEITNI